MKEKFRGMLKAGVLIVHDNAPAHMAQVLEAAIRHYGFEEQQQQ